MKSSNSAIQPFSLHDNNYDNGKKRAKPLIYNMLWDMSQAAFAKFLNQLTCLEARRLQPIIATYVSA